MTKRILAIILVFCLCLVISTSVFADDASSSIKNAVEDTGAAIKEGLNNAGNVVKDAGNGLRNGAEDVGNGIKSGVEDVGNTLDMNDRGNMGQTAGDNGGYTATRTATGNTNNGMNNSTFWTWAILAIVAVAIVGLVWYYAMQNQNTHSNIDE